MLAEPLSSFFQTAVSSRQHFAELKIKYFGDYVTVQPRNSPKLSPQLINNNLLDKTFACV
jgi:hypothetical protein